MELAQAGDSRKRREHDVRGRRRPRTARPWAPSRVGAELRAARQRLGWALPDVAAELRIRLPYPRGDRGRAGSPTCRATPTRSASCAPMRRSLGLDAGRGGAAVPRRGARGEPQDRADLPGPGAGARRAGRGGGAARRGARRRRLCGLVSVLRRRAGADAGRRRRCRSGWRRWPTAPAPPRRNLSPQVASILPPRRRRPAAADARPAPPAAAPRRRRRPVPVPVAVPSRRPRRAAAAGADAAGVVLRFKADAWIQVREKQGQVLLNRVMRAGETWPVPNGPAPAADHRQRRRHRDAAWTASPPPPLGRRRRGAARHAARAGCDASCRRRGRRPLPARRRRGRSRSRPAPGPICRRQPAGGAA